MKNFDRAKKQRLNNKGYDPREKIFDSKTIKEDEQFYTPLNNEQFDKTKIDDILIIANRIELKGSEPIFFELPTNLLRTYFCDKYLSDYEKSILHISKHYKLLSVDSSLVKKRHYRDIDHLNSFGANIVTYEILRLLK